MRSGGTGRCTRAHALMSGLCRHNTRHLLFICFLLRWSAASVLLRWSSIFSLSSGLHPDELLHQGLGLLTPPDYLQPDAPRFLIRIRPAPESPPRIPLSRSPKSGGGVPECIVTLTGCAAPASVCGDVPEEDSHATPLLHLCKNRLPPTLLSLRQNPLFSRRFQHFLTLRDKYTCRIVDARKAIASYARQPLLLRKQPH